MKHIDNKIIVKDYRTVTYKDFEIDFSPELIQDVHHGSIDSSSFEEHIYKEYLKHLPSVRNKKINQILE